MMVRHDTIADNVFITEYGDGSKIASNYNEKPFNYNGREIKPVNYILIPPTK